VIAEVVVVLAVFGVVDGDAAEAVAVDGAGLLDNSPELFPEEDDLFVDKSNSPLRDDPEPR